MPPKTPALSTPTLSQPPKPVKCAAPPTSSEPPLPLEPKPVEGLRPQPRQQLRRSRWLGCDV
ncbi:hypothetical protein U9M48_018614 [Paspalum notatum var. saurae]|uniref:Uncharacterized protein n=1 Tax=Paspalum notatum var. saurae TaxID=547442 RepID=A0AAQ3T9S0_PASNO